MHCPRCGRETYTTAGCPFCPADPTTPLPPEMLEIPEGELPLTIVLTALTVRVTRLERAVRRYGGLPTEPMRCRKCRAALSQLVSGWQWNPEAQRWVHYCRGAEIGYAAEPDVPPPKGGE